MILMMLQKKGQLPFTNIDPIGNSPVIVGKVHKFQLYNSLQKSIYSNEIFRF